MTFWDIETEVHTLEAIKSPFHHEFVCIEAAEPHFHYKDDPRLDGNRITHNAQLTGVRQG
jgi:hypothetical protein